MGVFKRWINNRKGKTAYWYIRYTVNKKLKWESIGKVGEVTKAVAQAHLEERKKQIRLGTYNLMNIKVPTLNEIKNEYIQYKKDILNNRSWKKDQSHIKRWSDYLGNKLLSEITAKDIDGYKLKRQTEVKAVTVNRELQSLRHLFNLAKKWKKYFGENPVSESGLIKTESHRKRILSYEEETILIQNSSPHLKPIIQTALLTAMRLGELLTLRWQDVDLKNNLITVRAEIAKSKKQRKIPISNRLKDILQQQRYISGLSGMVFLTQNGTPYSPKNSSALKRTFTTARKKSGLMDLRFHDLRHTAATRMAENGASVVAVKEICGHANINTTLQYFHPDKSLIEAVEILADI